MADEFSALRLNVLALYAVLGLIAIIYAITIGHYNAANFITSQDFMADYGWQIFGVTLALSVFLVACVCGPIVVAAYRARPHKPHNEDAQAIMFVLTLWLFLYGFCISIAPLVSTVFYAQNVKAVFTVKDVPWENFRTRGSCRLYIKLSDTSRWSRKLCRVDEALIQALQPGDQIILTGRGNYFGMRVQCIRLANLPAQELFC